MRTLIQWLQQTGELMLQHRYQYVTRKVNL